MAYGQLIFPAHRKNTLIAQRVKVALPFNCVCVFTPVWNCFINLTLHDGDFEKRVNAAASRVEVYFIFTKKPQKNKGGQNVIYFMGPLGELDAQLQS